MYVIDLCGRKDFWNNVETFVLGKHSECGKKLFYFFKSKCWSSSTIRIARLGRRKGSYSKLSTQWRLWSKGASAWVWNPMTISCFAVWRGSLMNWLGTRRSNSALMTTSALASQDWRLMLESCANLWETSVWTISLHSSPIIRLAGWYPALPKVNHYCFYQ
jgi:hypothetical protein